MVSSPEEMSKQNNELLVQLSANLRAFVVDQQTENKRIHERIDSVQTHTAQAIDTVKEALSKTGKISPALIATVISLCAIIGGAVTTYVTGKMDNIIPMISANQRDITQQDNVTEVLREQMTRNRIDIAVNSAVINRMDDIGSRALIKGVVGDSLKFPTKPQ